MKQVICYIVFLCLVYHATAQKNIFFKKDRSKYTLISKKPEQLKKEQQLPPSLISLYTTALQVKRPFSFYMPKSYQTNNDNTLLYIIGLGGSILGSIYADKLHYNYTGNLMYPTINYRQNTY